MRAKALAPNTSLARAQLSARFRYARRQIFGPFRERLTCFRVRRGSTLGKIVPKSRNQYLAAAAECVRLAGQISDPVRKLMLVDLAATWVRLAEQADKNEHLDLVYETPSSAQRSAASH
jgi:hypothetical protein